MRKMICVLLLLIISGTCFTSVAADTEYSGNQGHYVYPIDVTSESWFDYTVLEKSEMLRIDDETLGKMTDETLVYAIADYPYLIDYLAYGEDVRRFSEYCSAMGELLSRETCADSLKKYSKQIIEEYKTTREKMGEARLYHIFCRISRKLYIRPQETILVDCVITTFLHLMGTRFL